MSPYSTLTGANLDFTETSPYLDVGPIFPNYFLLTDGIYPAEEFEPGREPLKEPG